MRRMLLAVAAWLAAGAAAVIVGLLALSLLRSGITGARVQPLSEQEVTAALAQATTTETSPPSSSPPPPNQATPSPTATAKGPNHTTRALDSPGGTVIARCTQGQAYLVSWTPRQGFDSDEQDHGPAPTVTAQFESEDLDVHVAITCRDGLPTSHVTTEHDD